MECRESVAGEGPGPLGILLETLAQPVQVPERRGVEHVHVGVRGQERVEHRPVEPVAGMEERGHPVVTAAVGQGRIGRDQGHHLVGLPGVDGGDEGRRIRHGQAPRGSAGLGYPPGERGHAAGTAQHVDSHGYDGRPHTVT